MKFTFLTPFLMGAVAFSVSAADYNYLTEGFEDANWQQGKATVSVATGDWTVNKNKSTTSEAHSGSASLEFTAKQGLTSPRLTKGAGAIIYYALDTNRQVTVEKSSDGNTWIGIESYKETTPWTRHIVMVNDPDARYVRFSINSNKQFYLDDLLITLPDGTDGEGNSVVTMLDLPYFTQNFENKNEYPASKDAASSETSFDVAGQGQWVYYNAYRGTNESYISDGSGASLRMLKNGSYVVTPVLSQGVVSVRFNEGRTQKKLNLYTSSDEGVTWTLAKNIVTDTDNSVFLYDRDINRIKIANESSSDADIDNLTVTAYPEGTPATVNTTDPVSISSSSATVGGSITSQGDRPVISAGICWTSNGTPSVAANTVAATGSDFTVTITGLPAETNIKYCAYAISLAGVAYGEVKEFKTADAQKPSVEAGSIDMIEDLSSETSLTVNAYIKIVDNGGAPINAAGYIVETPGLPTVEADARQYNDNLYLVGLKLMPETDYTLTPYAENRIGRSLGTSFAYTTPKVVTPEYAHKVYYCDPEGDDSTADGSEQHPFFSLQKAADLVNAGDTIYMNSGTYKYASRINIKNVGEKNSGKIALFARGGRAVLDFSSMAVADNNQGIRLTGSHWHIYGIDIYNAGDNGLLIERDKPTGGSYSDIAANTHQGHHNIIENCSFVRNADTGLQMKNLAAYNMVINCDSYFNIDPGEGNADGFAVKISHGDGNYFYGCRAWRNSDDGWDQFIKKEGGFPDDITTTLDNCWAFENGYLENGEPCSGNGNGFKMGSDQGRNNIIMNRCLAFDNLQKGFDQNHNTGNMILNNCTGYAAKYTANSSHYTYRMDEGVAAGHEIRFTNCIAISDGISDRNKSEYAPYSVTGKQITCDFNTLPEDFVSISTLGTDGSRDENGNLPELDFMKIRPGNSRLIDAGTPVTPYEGESVFSTGITFNGAAPDLGCFETGETLGIDEIFATNQASDLSVGITSTNCGLIVLNVEGLQPTDQSFVTVCNLTGQMIYSAGFNGTTTTLDLRGNKGIAIISIRTPKGHTAIKTEL
ncbi:MAG: right-handed parallel beta-helix repeat-containing protein [Muribaculaceae bacterium]|nr:right-handed parallel beta-helix repeat-containing protein [Muribaculaceae bacterium]